MFTINSSLDKQALLTAWLEALRSEKYPQDKGHLKTREGFCCLGVLCDVIDNTKWNDYNNTHYQTYGPSKKVASTDGDINLFFFGNSGISRGTLMDMNDCENKSFKEIADYIENNFNI